MKEIANLKTQLVKTFPQSSKLNARISTHKMSESLRPSTHSSDFTVAIRPISKRRVTRYQNTFDLHSSIHIAHNRTVDYIVLRKPAKCASLLNGIDVKFFFSFSKRTILFYGSNKSYPVSILII